MLWERIDTRPFHPPVGLHECFLQATQWPVLGGQSTGHLAPEHAVTAG